MCNKAQLNLCPTSLKKIRSCSTQISLAIPMVIISKTLTPYSMVFLSFVSPIDYHWAWSDGTIWTVMRLVQFGVVLKRSLLMSSWEGGGTHYALPKNNIFKKRYQRTQNVLKTFCNLSWWVNGKAQRENSMWPTCWCSFDWNQRNENLRNLA